jgi:hypothetical protein
VEPDLPSIPYSTNEPQRSSNNKGKVVGWAKSRGAKPPPPPVITNEAPEEKHEAFAPEPREEVKFGDVTRGDIANRRAVYVVLRGDGKHYLTTNEPGDGEVGNIKHHAIVPDKDSGITVTKKQIDDEDLPEVYIYDNRKNDEIEVELTPGDIVTLGNIYPYTVPS